MGLNPNTGPIQFFNLQGTIKPYITKGGTDQLRKINGISIAIVSMKNTDSMLTVHVKATDPVGRSDEDYGTVPIKGLTGADRQRPTEGNHQGKAPRHALDGRPWLHG
jgi:hypothetical protein